VLKGFDFGRDPPNGAGADLDSARKPAGSLKAGEVRSRPWNAMGGEFLESNDGGHVVSPTQKSRRGDPGRVIG
jgi:hypothetical protein